MKMYSGQVEYNLRHVKRSVPNESLFEAVRQGSIFPIIDHLRGIRGSIDVIKDKDGNTLLHCASQYGHLQVVNLLLKEETVPFTILLFEAANVNAKRNDDKTPLHLAAREGHEVVVKTLLEKRANIDAKDNDGWTPLHYAACKGHQEVVWLLLDRGAKIDAKSSDDGKEPIHLAAQEGYSEIVQLLLSNGANIEAQDKDGWTPLHYAAWKGYLEIAQLLLDRGAKVDAKSNPDNDSKEPIHVSAAYGKKDVVKSLLDSGVNINVTTKSGLTPLHYAAREGYLEIAQLLLDRGANIEATESYGWTPLHYAVWKDRQEVARLLLDRGAKVKAKSREGQTPLDIAYNYDNNFFPEVIKLFVEKLAKLDEVTPLHSAVKYGSSKVVELFINDTVNAQEENHGWTPLHFAAQESNKKDIAELLIARNATVDARNYRGWTPLHEAASKAKLDVAWLFVEKGADINARNNKGWTPLHEAAKKGNSDIVDFLIKISGTDIEAQSRNRKDTPLHVAAGEGKLEVVKLLVNDATANVNARNKYGKKPLDIAKDKNHTGIINFLTPKTSRRRRDVSNEQEFSAASGSARTTSWINDYIAWIKDSASYFIGNIPFKRTTSLLTNNIQVDYSTFPKKQLPYGSKDNTEITISQIDFNGTIALLDVFVRRFTGERYPSFQGASLSQLEVLGYALNITQAFEKAIEQAAKESGISMHRLSIDFVEVQGEITKKVSGGRFDEIPGILNLHVMEACSNIKSGKLSPKKLDRFITAFNNELPQISYEKGRNISLSTANYIDNQDFRLKGKDPSNYLEGISVQGSLTQVKGV